MSKHSRKSGNVVVADTELNALETKAFNSARTGTSERCRGTAVAFQLLQLQQLQELQKLQQLQADEQASEERAAIVSIQPDDY